MESQPTHSLIRCKAILSPRATTPLPQSLQDHGASGEPAPGLSWGQPQSVSQGASPCTMYRAARSSPPPAACRWPRSFHGALAQGKIKPGADTALVVVDVQNCFMPGGSLAVKGGDEIVPLINKIAKASRTWC